MMYDLVFHGSKCLTIFYRYICTQCNTTRQIHVLMQIFKQINKGKAIVLSMLDVLPLKFAKNILGFQAEFQVITFTFEFLIEKPLISVF